MNSLLVLFIIIPVLIVLLLSLNYLLAPSRPDSEKLSLYECGFSTVHGQTRSNFHINFYLIAMLFLIFDLEIVLFFPYAVSVLNVGFFGFVVATIFFSILTIGFVVEIGTGVINLNSSNNKKLESTLPLSSGKDQLAVKGYLTGNHIKTQGKQGTNKGSYSLMPFTVFYSNSSIFFNSFLNEIILIFLMTVATSLLIIFIISILEKSVKWLKTFYTACGLDLKIMNFKIIIYYIIIFSILCSWFFNYITISSISVIIKVVFLLILMVLSVYGLHLEVKLSERINYGKNNWLQSMLPGGGGLRKKLSEYFFVVIPALIGYAEIMKNFDESKRKAAEEQQKAAENDFKERIKNAKDLEEKTKLEGSLIEADTFMSDSLKLHNDLKENKSKLNDTENLINKLKNKPKSEITAEDKTLLEQAKSAKIRLDTNKERLEKMQERLMEKVDNILKKRSIFPLDIEFGEIREKLINMINEMSIIEKLALCGLALNQVILNSIISIVFVFYGDFLIKRFDIENKYPKISKFIQLRRKFQEYYLKINLITILICLLPQMYVYFMILLPKIMLILS